MSSRRAIVFSLFLACSSNGRVTGDCFSPCYDPLGASGGAGGAGKSGGGGAGAGAAGEFQGGGQQGGASVGGSGSGGASAGAAAGDGGAQAWVFDPNIWSKVSAPSGDTSTGCPLFVASTGLQFRALEWESCGAGCEIVAPTTFYPTGYAVLGTVVVNGVTEPLAALLEGTKYGAPLTSLLSWRNLATGEVHGAVRRYEQGNTGCSAPSTNWDEPRMGSFHDVLFSAKWEDGFSLKVSAAVPAGLLQFASGVWGMSATETTFFSGGGQIKAYPIDQPPYVLESQTNARWGDVDGDLAVWVAVPRLKGWANDGQGVRTIAESLPFPIYAPAVSPTRIVAVLGDDLPHPDPGVYSTVRFWTAPRAAKDVSNLGSLVDHPFQAPGGVAFAPSIAPHTWGDWASVAVSWTDAKNLPHQAHLVAHLPSKKTWTLTPRAGTVFGVSSTLDENYLYLTEESTTKPYPFRILRLTLAELDGYVAGQPPL